MARRPSHANSRRASLRVTAAGWSWSCSPSTASRRRRLLTAAPPRQERQRRQHLAMQQRCAARPDRAGPGAHGAGDSASMLIMCTCTHRSHKHYKRPIQQCACSTWVRASMLDGSPCLVAPIAQHVLSSCPQRTRALLAPHALWPCLPMPMVLQRIEKRSRIARKREAQKAADAQKAITCSSINEDCSSSGSSGGGGGRGLLASLTSRVNAILGLTNGKSSSSSGSSAREADPTARAGPGGGSAATAGAVAAGGPSGRLTLGLRLKGGRVSE